MPHTSLDLGLSVADRIRRETTTTTIQYLKIPHGLTMSVGLANLTQDAPATGEAMLAMADQALYAAKQAGRDRVVTHQQLQQEVQEIPANATSVSPA